MRVEAEQRRSIGFETKRSANHVASAVAGSARVTDGLDWQSFSAAYFPGRRRHDLEALTAYGAYRRSHEVDARSSDEPPGSKRSAARQARPRYRTGKTRAARRSEVVANGSRSGTPADSRTSDQIDSRSAFAAACRRSLTSASSRAARSMRSCCASARACWLSARRCWLSACSLIALSWLSIPATVRVRSATCAATLAMSSSAVTTAEFSADDHTLQTSAGPASRILFA